MFLFTVFFCRSMPDLSVFRVAGKYKYSSKQKVDSWFLLHFGCCLYTSFSSYWSFCELFFWKINEHYFRQISPIRKVTPSVSFVVLKMTLWFKFMNKTAVFCSKL